MHVYIPFEIPLRSISPPPSTGYQFFQPSSLISASPFLKNAGSVRNRTATGSQFATCFNTYIDTYVYCRMYAFRGEICMQRDGYTWKGVYGFRGKRIDSRFNIHGTGLLRKEIARISQQWISKQREKKRKGKRINYTRHISFFSYRKTKSSSFHRVYRRLPKSKD